MSDTQQLPLERLFEFGVTFAQSTLAEIGEFFPFGATVSAQGEIAGLGGDIDMSGEPDQDEVYEQVLANLKEVASQPGIQAVALFDNVRLPEGDFASDRAIRIQMESEAFARSIFIPYRYSADQPGVVELTDPIEVDVAPVFFKAQS
jgi:hypothetical protein